MKLPRKTLRLAALPLLAMVTVGHTPEREQDKCYPVFNQMLNHEMAIALIAQTGIEAPRGYN